MNRHGEVRRLRQRDGNLQRSRIGITLEDRTTTHGDRAGKAGQDTRMRFVAPVAHDGVALDDSAEATRIVFTDVGDLAVVRVVPAQRPEPDVGIGDRLDELVCRNRGEIGVPRRAPATGVGRGVGKTA